MWGLSSAGRASDLHSEGHRFEPDRLHHIRFASFEFSVCINIPHFKADLYKVVVRLNFI